MAPSESFICVLIHFTLHNADLQKCLVNYSAAYMVIVDIEVPAVEDTSSPSAEMTYSLVGLRDSDDTKVSFTHSVCSTC